VAQSPTEAGQAVRGTYRAGWKAVFRMMKEGLSWSGREANCVFLNRDGQRFADVSGVSGLDFTDDGRGLAIVDWDHDGRLDLWIANRTAPQARFLRNTADTGHSFLALRLSGTGRNTDAIGARVELYMPGVPKRIRTLHAGDGYLSQSSKWVHFGLGSARQIERVIVRWPGPKHDESPEEFKGLEPDRHYVLEQGSGTATPWTSPHATVSLEPSTLEAPAASERARVVLAGRIPMPRLEYLGEDGMRPLRWGGGPALLNLWGSWCAPCIAELKSFGEHADELRRRGLSVLALSVDEPSDRVVARDTLAGLGWPFESGYATSEMLDTLDTVQRFLLSRKRRLPLPTSFLVDAQGRLAVIYKGPLELETLLADVASLDDATGDARDRTTPFAGRWLSSVEDTQGLVPGITRELFNRGLVEAAADYFLTIAPPTSGARTSSITPADYRQSCRQLAEELERRGRAEAAAELWERALELDPDDREVRNRLEAIRKEKR